jgi:hypothetical protein
VKDGLPLWREGGMEPSPLPAVPPTPIHVPPGSVWPLCTAIGILIMAVGGLLHHSLWPSVGTALAGAAVTVTGIYKWAFEPFEV